MTDRRPSRALRVTSESLTVESDAAGTVTCCDDGVTIARIPELESEAALAALIEAHILPWHRRA